MRQSGKNKCSKYNRGSGVTKEHCNLEYGCLNAGRRIQLFVLLSTMILKSGSLAYASANVLDYIDEACLEKLTEQQKGSVSSLESQFCFGAPDPSRDVGEGQGAGFAVLMDAVRGLQRALVTASATENPTRVAILKNNLGDALVLLGHLQSDETILREGIMLLREVLRSIDGQRNPLLFALTQRHLASALVTLSATTKEADHVSEAVERYRIALNIFDGLGEGELAASTRRMMAPNQSQRLPSVPARDLTGDKTADAGPIGPDLGAGTMKRPPPPASEIDPAVELRLYGSLSFTAVTGRADLVGDGGSGYDYEFSTDPEVNLAVSYDNGMGFDYGAEILLDVEDLDDTTSVVHFSGGFGEVRFGQDSGAEDDMYIGGGDYQAGTGGIDGDAANLVGVSLTGSDDALKGSYYTPRFQGVQFGLSFTPDTVDVTDQASLGDDVDDEDRFQDHVGLGANWVANIKQADILAAVVGSFGEATEGDDLSSYSVGGGVSLGAYQFGAGYTDETNFNKRELLNFGVIRRFDPWLDGLGGSHLGAGVALLLPEDEGNSTVLALSGDLELAAGLRLLGDIAYRHQNGSASSNDPADVSGVLAIEMSY